MTNEGHVKRLRDVGLAALAIAFPYALFTGAVAVASRTALAAPSLWQAVTTGFGIAFLAGGLGAARGLAPWRKLAGRVPPRARSVLLGMVAALAMLAVFGAVLAAASLAIHLELLQGGGVGPQPRDRRVRAAAAGQPQLPAELGHLGDRLHARPGVRVRRRHRSLAVGGGARGRARLPDAGGDAGRRQGRVPALARLLHPRAALPGRRAGRADDGAHRADTDPRGRPAWGLLTGSLTAAVIGLAAKLSGGPPGDRLASVGPAGGEIGLVAVLEIGVTAALVAGAANWLILRHHIRRLPAAAPAAERLSGPLPRLVVDQTDDDGGHRIYVDPWADDITE